mgnify:CR=1 FL=1
MGAETAEIKSIQDAIDLDNEPRMGRKRKKGPMGYPEDTEIRYFVGCITDQEHRFELEEIMTKSLQCGGELKSSGDIFVVSESGSFDKDGCYQVVVKYLYLP